MEYTGIKNFNPHEREARDQTTEGIGQWVKIILIHTSVKLVTRRFSGERARAEEILIHTSVKLVTRRGTRLS